MFLGHCSRVISSRLYRGLYLITSPNRIQPHPGYSGLHGQHPRSDKIKYLGSMVSWIDPTLEAINHSISQAHIDDGKLSAFWKATVPKKTRLTICRSYVVSVLLYGLWYPHARRQAPQEDRQLVLPIPTQRCRYQSLVLLSNS